MEEKTQTYIRVQDVQKRYGWRKILKGASFEVQSGQCVALLGMNGSGKSTLLSILAGVQNCERGTAVVNGINLLTDKKTAGKIVGYVPQENPLIQDLTVRDNLKLWYCDSPLDMEKELREGLLKMLGIDRMLHMPVKKLSGGMKKRVSIGISMWANPKVLLMDEPAAALDLVAKRDIRNYLQYYLSQGNIVVLATHDEEELDISDKVYIMKQGILCESSKWLRGEELIKEIMT